MAGSSHSVTPTLVLTLTSLSAVWAIGPLWALEITLGPMVARKAGAVSSNRVALFIHS